jgi:hypothetical protein
MWTYIIIGLIVVAALAIAAIVSPKFRGYLKWIGAGLVAVGGVIVLIATLGKKKSNQTADKKIATDNVNIAHAEDKTAVDEAKVTETDQKIKQGDADIQKKADEAKQKAKDNVASTKPDKPGDVAQAVDDLNNALK